MSRRHRPARRRGREASPELVRRGLLLLAGLALLVVVVQVSAAGVFRSTKPALALKVTPFDAGARSRLASQVVSTEESREIARGLALDAIRRDSVQPVALRVLAQSLNQADPDSNETEIALMQQSERLSRRDRLTQIWLAEHFGRRGDLKMMVHHLDIALRSSDSTRAGMFPMLAGAAADPASEAIIIDTLSARPNWAGEFTSYAIGYGSDLEFAAEVARRSLDTSRGEDRKLYGVLMDRLAAQGRYELAWDIYGLPGLAPRKAQAARLRNGDFETEENESPFDWWLSQEPELWASRVRSGTGGFELQVAAFNGRSGEVARQILRLAPGTYRMRARMGDLPQDPFERPEIRIECASGRNPPLLRLKPGSAGAGPLALDASLTVPRNCPYQRMTIFAAGDGPMAEPLPWVDDLRIE